MFGIGTTEILVILVVALIVLGPKSLPKVARTLGKGLAEFRKVSTDFQRTINTEIELEEREKRKKEAEKRLNKQSQQTEEASAEPVEDPTGELATAPDMPEASDTSVKAEAVAETTADAVSGSKESASTLAGDKA